MQQELILANNLLHDYPNSWNVVLVKHFVGG